MAWTPTRSRIVGVILEEKVMGRAYGGFVIVFNLLRTITAFIIGYTVIYGYTILMATSGIMVLAGAVASYIVLYLRFKETIRVRPSISSLIEGYKSLFRFPRSIYPLIYFSILDSFAWRLWYPLINAYLKQYRFLIDTDISNYNTMLGLSMLITAYLAGHITDKIKPVKSLVLYELIGIIGLIILQLPAPLLYASSILLGFSIAFWIPAYNVLTTFLYGPHKVGRLRGLTDTVRMTAGIPAPQIGGLLLQYNPLYNYVFSIILMGLAILPLSRIKYGKG
jgi:DHA1 family multidrug resistance protein-like MFS transporter